MKKPFFLPFLVIAILAFSTPLAAQTQFVRKLLDCPGSRTVGARTAFADLDIDGSTLLIYRNQSGAIDTFPQPDSPKNITKCSTKK